MPQNIIAQFERLDDLQLVHEHLIELNYQCYADLVMNQLFLQTMDAYEFVKDFCKGFQIEVEFMIEESPDASQ